MDNSEDEAENPGNDSFLGRWRELFNACRNGPSGLHRQAGAKATALDLKCCSGRVHIAFRGVSDDRLYLAENRTSSEVKFYRPYGLRVFCAECRKRML